MKILFVRQVIPYPPTSGTKQRGFHLLRELGKRHEVHLLAFHHKDQLAAADVEPSRQALLEHCTAVEYFDLWPKRSKLHGAMALGAALPFPVPFSVLAHHCPALTARIREIVNGSDRPDLVHFDTIGLTPFAELCRGIPCTLGHQNVESQLMARRTEYERSLAAKVYGRLQTRRLLDYERKHCPRFRTNVVVSQLDAQELERVAPGSHCTVIDNGVDLEFFTPRSGAEPATLIYAGGMDMFANRDAVEWFIDEIWPRVKAQIPDARFLAVGQYPSAKVLAAGKADPAIEVPGFVPDVRTWVARAAVYVVPLRIGGGTRVKIMDAMAQGKAIVSTRIGAEGIAGESGVHLQHADQPEEFAGEVVRLLRDQRVRAEMGQKARALAEARYSWATLGGRLSAAFEEIAGAPSAEPMRVARQG